jgi:hypothetical protein
VLAATCPAGRDLVALADLVVEQRARTVEM